MIKRILVVVFITLCTTTTLSMVYDLIVNGPFKHVYGGSSEDSGLNSTEMKQSVAQTKGLSEDLGLNSTEMKQSVAQTKGSSEDSGLNSTEMKQSVAQTKGSSEDSGLNSTEMKQSVAQTKDYVENKGFIITMSYGKDDQQTVAACSIFTQMCWLRSFNLGPHTAIVEPFVNVSHFVHTPAHWTAADVQDIQVMRFGDFYDLRHLRLTSKKAKASKLVGWEYFLRRAPRDIVAVTIQDLDGESEKCFGKINRPELACRYGQQNKSQIGYFTSGCNTSEVDNAIDYLKHHDFRIVKHVCLNCGHGLPSTGYSPNDIMDMIMRNNSLRNTTILFNTWTYATNLAKDCQLYRFCSNCGDFNNNEYKKLMPSNRLKHDSKKYLKDVLNATSISVAIMIRTERMFKMLKTGDNVLHCLDSIVNDYADIVSTLSKENNMQTSKPLITIDIGTFGTDSYSISCPEYTNYTEIEAKFEYLLSHLYSGEWTMERYENGLSYAAGGVTESGYIAGIQRVLASQARCLVLYGAGHFQALAEYHYKLQHPNKADQCIHHMMKCGYKF